MITKTKNSFFEWIGCRFIDFHKFLVRVIFTIDKAESQVESEEVNAIFATWLVDILHFFEEFLEVVEIDRLIRMFSSELLNKLNQLFIFECFQLGLLVHEIFEHLLNHVVSQVVVHGGEAFGRVVEDSLFHFFGHALVLLVHEYPLLLLKVATRQVVKGLAMIIRVRVRNESPLSVQSCTWLSSIEVFLFFDYCLVHLLLSLYRF